MSRLQKKIEYREAILKANKIEIGQKKIALAGKIYTSGKMKGKPLPPAYLERLEQDIAELTKQNKNIEYQLVEFREALKNETSHRKSE